MKGRSTIRFLLIVLALLFFVVSATAQEKKGTGKKEDKTPDLGSGFGLKASRAPIDINSDTVEADQKQNVVSFKGNVVAKQEDITIYTNTLTVYYNPDTKKMKEIVAAGNVKVVQLDRRATSQKAIFYQEENKVVLEGDAVLREGDNVIRGERVTYYIDEQRSVVEGKKGGRVSTTITPKKDEK